MEFTRKYANPGSYFKNLKSIIAIVSISNSILFKKHVPPSISVNLAHKEIKSHKSDIILKMRYLSALTNLNLVSEHFAFKLIWEKYAKNINYSYNETNLYKL